MEYLEMFLLRFCIVSIENFCDLPSTPGASRHPRQRGIFNPLISSLSQFTPPPPPARIFNPLISSLSQFTPPPPPARIFNPLISSLSRFTPPPPPAGDI